MRDPEAIQMTDALKKFVNLREHYPNARGGDATYRFTAYLADTDSEYFSGSDRVSPEEFLITWSQAMLDVSSGSNSFSGKPVPSELVMLGEVILSLTMLDTEAIGQAVFPEAFAQAIREVLEVSRSLS